MAAPPTSSAPVTTGTSRPGEDWFFAGLASSFPNITDSSEPYFKLVWPQPCRTRAAGSSSSTDTPKVPACKIFHPKATQDPTETSATVVAQIDPDAAPGEDAWLMKEQVLVFRYKGRFHAVDHACPHRAYSLSWGVPFDIEDSGSGRTLGHAIRCRGHSFAFELTTGAGDRGGYRLGVWDVELRPVAGVVAAGDGLGRDGGEMGEEEEEEEREVWVRKGRKSGKQGPG
ncbi:rieske domain-containing protein [Diaporthe helianthi]|uniref:Rieske domain-containing protein n=1 Tax=Diaporthe helianthi TaxID=158607 RepID=A0A2P5IDM4_DIAHE|nr:rieske domain-containing protein [Diaporthe helianthi]